MRSIISKTMYPTFIPPILLLLILTVINAERDTLGQTNNDIKGGEVFKPTYSENDDFPLFLLTIKINRMLQQEESFVLRDSHGEEVVSYSSQNSQQLFKIYLNEGNYNLHVITFLNIGGLTVEILSSFSTQRSLVFSSNLRSSTTIPISLFKAVESKVLTNPSDCYPYDVYLTLHFSMNSFYNDCSFSLTNTVGQVLLSSDTHPFQSGINEHSLCLYPAQYTLVLMSTTAGWHGQYVDIFANTMLLSRETLYMDVKTRSVLFNLNFLVHPLYTNWFYLMNGVPPTNWNSDLQATSLWSTALPKAFPSFTTVTQYYVTSFTIQSINTYAFARISCMIYAGAILYLNGHEIGRVNMPSGIITSETHATESMSSPTTVTFTLIMSESFILITNCLAIELHSYDSYESVPSFDASVLLIPKDIQCDVLFEGQPVLQPFTPSVILSSIFDLNPSTHVTINHACNDTAIYWYNTNHYIIINQYSITPHSSCLLNTPSGWFFEGSNDGIIWTILDMRSHIQFSSFSPQEFQFYNMKAFLKYRFRFTECEYLTYKLCSGMALSDIRFSMIHLLPHCIDPHGYFQPSLLYEYSYLSCPEYSTGYQSTYCSSKGFTDFKDYCMPLKPARIVYPESSITFFFNVENEPVVPLVEAWLFIASVYPFLPEGLLLDPHTGAIYGKPTTLSDLKEYTITITNSAGSQSVVVSIEVRQKSASLSFVFVLVEIIIVFCIVCILVYIIRVIRSRKRFNLRKQVEV